MNWNNDEGSIVEGALVNVLVDDEKDVLVDCEALVDEELAGEGNAEQGGV